MPSDLFHRLPPDRAEAGADALRRLLDAPPGSALSTEDALLVLAAAVAALQATMVALSRRLDAVDGGKLG